MIEVTHLSKFYGNHAAVSDLSFTVEDGKIYGLLGPNGAGKSTTMNMMTGCLAPTSGEVKIEGYDIFDSPIEAKKRIGYLPEQPPLYSEMTPREYLTFAAKLKGVPRAEIPAQLEKVMSVTQIAEMQNRIIKNLSKGFKQRVGIAQALLGNPAVIILDEPTVGLDPKQIIEIRDLIKNLGTSHTVILSSHILSEVQAVCDHIMIISKGRLVASDTPENLEKLFKGETKVSLVVKSSVEAAEQVLNGLCGANAFTVASGDDGNAHITVSADDEAAIRESLFLSFSKAQLPILDMTAAKASLEDIFLEFTERENEADTATSSCEQSKANADSAASKEA